MKIGIDISVLQTPHRYRGIGHTAINFINNLPTSAKRKHSFVFYHYPLTEENPLDLLELEDIDYTTEVIQPLKCKKMNGAKLSRLVSSFFSKLRVYRDMKLGDSRMNNMSRLDHFIQFDQGQPLPSKREVRSTLVLYDLIPYIMEWSYLWSYSSARQHGRSVKGSLRIHYKRMRYLTKNRLITKKAANLIAISHHTKEDFVRYIGIPEEKINVCHLGVSAHAANKTKMDPKLQKYIDTTWGTMPCPINLGGKDYLLFVGGADPRRKLTELIAAFNNLRARGHDIKLVLAGDTMKGPNHIPVPELRHYFIQTSYLDDIYFLGFVSNEQREWLYKNTLAFVYPSVYEGFGLPVLEAMQYGTPVITYDNSSIKEMAQDAAIYVNDFIGIKNEVLRLQTDEAYANFYSVSGKKQFARYSWKDSAKKMLSVISS